MDIKYLPLSASSMEDFQFLKEKYALNFEMLWGDGTTLRTIAISEPIRV